MKNLWLIRWTRYEQTTKGNFERSQKEASCTKTRTTYRAGRTQKKAQAYDSVEMSNPVETTGSNKYEAVMNEKRVLRGMG